MISLTQSATTAVPAEITTCQSDLEAEQAVQNQPEKLQIHTQQEEGQYNTMAFILAGGRGTRLHPLTSKRCKPAVPFGGSCRIIDFTLSNCINSGISKVGVLTQYKQHSLINHLGGDWGESGHSLNNCVEILPAQYDMQFNGYRGTADAIAQNLEQLEQHAPKYTLILSGDHVYKADYRRMIKQHIQNNAEVTVSCCEVPADTAQRFGVVQADSHQKIASFEEKPEQPATVPERPDSSLISMGIYLFKTQLLIDILQSESAKLGFDFGRDIFPGLIKKHDVFAYRFDRAQFQHYWQDIGTIDSYFEANMHLLDPVPAVDLNDCAWPVHTHCSASAPARLGVDSLGHSGFARDCIVASGCSAHGARIEHSILFKDVLIDENSSVENSLILPGARIGKECKIKNAIIDSSVCVADGTEIGYDWRQDALQYHVSPKGVVVVAEAPPPTRQHTSVNISQRPRIRQEQPETVNSPETDQILRIFN